MRLAPIKLVFAGMVALSLTSCERPAAPVVAPIPPTPPAATPRPVAARWSFRAGDVCVATAGSIPLALDIGASRDRLELVAHVGRDAPPPGKRSVPIAFVGPSGAWQVIGQRTAARRVIASLPMTDDQAGRILILLRGGTITIGNRDLGLPPLRVPNSGPAGREWFECVRRLLYP